MSHIRAMSLKKKITIAVFALLLTLFLIYALFLNISFKLYNNTIYESKAGEIGANMKCVEEELQAVEALSEEYMTQKNMQEALEKWSGTQSDYERTEKKGEISEYLMSLATRKSYISSVMLCDMNGRSIKWERSGNIPKSLYSAVQKEAVPKNGANRWIEPKNGEDFFTSARTVRKVKDRSFSPLGTLFIIVDMNSMVEDACMDRTDANMKLFIYGKEKIHGDNAFADTGVIEKFLKENRDCAVKSIGGTKYFAVKVLGQKTHCKYVALTDMNTLFSNVKRFNITVIVCFVFICIFLLILTGFASRRLLGRLELLCENMKEMENGNLRIKNPEKIPQNSRDEIDILTKRFYSMAEEIDNLVNENYKKALLFRETQLKLLQSQIKPHFLYNTLETINWMAISKGQKEISAMVKALGNLLRNSIGKNQYIVTVKEEIKLLEDYLLIQKNRFGEALEVSVDVSEELYSYSVLKMSLQIPVENSIKHVLEKNGGICKIEISIKKKDNNLLLCVSDNGGGIPDNIIEGIKNGEYGESTGIGLENIEKRIKLIFGDSYGLEIHNRKEGGATVIMKIPQKTVDCIKKLFEKE